MLVTIKSKGNRFFYLYRTDVLYMEDNGEDVHIHLRNNAGTLVIVNSTAKEMHQMLNSGKANYTLDKHWRLADV